MKLDHERARVHAEEVVKLEETVACLGNLSNLSACYLDAMTQLDKAEKVCEAFHRCRVISRVTKDGGTVAAIEDQARVQKLYEAYTDYRALLDERK